MKLRHFAALLLLPLALSAAEKLTVTVSHDLAIARPSETVAIKWSDVNAALPHALIQRIIVRDAKGRELPYQVTNVKPESKDPENIGVAYGELLFQYDFAAGEKSATFTVQKADKVSGPYPTKVFARYVPERLDDFGWENDRIAHRTYGQALGAPDTEKRGKEVLVTSGIDVWCKRVDYPIVDRWYNKGHDHYHKDEGEGMDMYQVGTSRGCGGTGVWDGSKLYVGRNYKSWKVLANGPVRAIFELTYEAWDAKGMQVSEVKRYTVDAGHNLDQIDSTFTFEGAPELTIAIGLNKTNADKGQNPKVEVAKDDAGWLSQWTVQQTNDSLGAALIVPAAFKGFAEDEKNELALVTVTSGKPVRFYAGAGWTRSGQFKDRAAWDAYVANMAARAKSPVRIELK